MVRSALNQLRWAAAGGLLLVGAAWAGTIYHAAPAYRGPDPAQLEALASRLASPANATESPLPDPPAVAPPRRVIAPPAPRRAVAPAVSHSSTPAPVLPPAGLAPAAPAPAASVAAAPAKPAESPVKSLALMGLTHRDQEDAAWLVDLNNMNRETAEVGERAFGFTVKEIGEDSVLLTRGGEEFELRLGEKSIPVPAGSQSVASADDGGFGDPSGFGNGRMGRRGRGQGGFGAFSGGAGGFSGGSGRSFRSGFGGRGNFSASSSTPGLGSSSNYSGNSGYSGNRGSRSSFGSTSSFRSGGTNSFRSGSTGSFGGGFSGGRNSGSGGMTSQFSAAGSTTSTSNPQTARRRGARLTGDAAAIQSPQAITNPQTARRTGSSSGSAFGQAGAAGTGNTRSAGSQFGGR